MNRSNIWFTALVMSSLSCVSSNGSKDCEPTLRLTGFAESASLYTHVQPTLPVSTSDGRQIESLDLEPIANVTGTGAEFTFAGFSYKHLSSIVAEDQGTGEKTKAQYKWLTYSSTYAMINYTEQEISGFSISRRYSSSNKDSSDPSEVVDTSIAKRGLAITINPMPEYFSYTNINGTRVPGRSGLGPLAYLNAEEIRVSKFPNAYLSEIASEDTLPEDLHFATTGYGLGLGGTIVDKGNGSTDVYSFAAMSGDARIYDSSDIKVKQNSPGTDSASVSQSNFGKKTFVAISYSCLRDSGMQYGIYALGDSTTIPRENYDFVVGGNNIQIFVGYFAD